MIDELLPDTVAVAEAFGRPPGPPLYPEEETVVGDSVAKRRREFAVGRGCARQALAALGLPPAPLLPGTRGQPLWPAGVVGAITHCDGYCAAVAAVADDIAGVGVDAEPAKPLPAGILDAVSLPEERARLPRATPYGRPVPWDRLLFSAKESVYKVWFPLTGQRLEFEDACITFYPACGEEVVREADGGVWGTGGEVRGTLIARILVPAFRLGDTMLSGLTGRFLVRDGVLVTAISVPAARQEARGGEAVLYQSAPARPHSAL